MGVALRVKREGATLSELLSSFFIFSLGRSKSPTKRGLSKRETGSSRLSKGVLARSKAVRRSVIRETDSVPVRGKEGVWTKQSNLCLALVESAGEGDAGALARINDLP